MSNATKNVVSIDGPGQNGERWQHRTVELQHGRPVRFRDSGPGWRDQDWTSTGLELTELVWAGAVQS